MSVQFEKEELLKELRYYYPSLKVKVCVKVWMQSSGYIYFSPSHFYKPDGAADYYDPSAGAGSADEAIERAETYLKDFTKDFISNSSF